MALLDHFTVRRLTFANTEFGVQLQCFTNNACHLTMRWTYLVPQKHINTTQRRGAQIGTYIDQCFTVFHDNEQEEPGDTWTHTFTKEPWDTCETRWFYFWGTVGGVVSPSASAIFEYHRTGQAPPTLKCHTYGNDTDYAGMYNCSEGAGGFEPGASFVARSIDIRYQTATAALQCYSGRLRFYTAKDTAEPDALIWGPHAFTHPYMGDYEWRTQHIILPHLQFLAGHRYSVAVSWEDTNPGSTARRMRWCRPPSATCPITPTPTTHFWTRSKDHLSDPPCQGDWSVWYPAAIQAHHYHQFYGDLI